MSTARSAHGQIRPSAVRGLDAAIAVSAEWPAPRGSNPTACRRRDRPTGRSGRVRSGAWMPRSPSAPSGQRPGDVVGAALAGGHRQPPTTWGRSSKRVSNPVAGHTTWTDRETSWAQRWLAATGNRRLPGGVRRRGFRTLLRGTRMSSPVRQDNDTTEEPQPRKPSRRGVGQGELASLGSARRRMSSPVRQDNDTTEEPQPRKPSRRGVGQGELASLTLSPQRFPRVLVRRGVEPRTRGRGPGSGTHPTLDKPRAVTLSPQRFPRVLVRRGVEPRTRGRGPGSGTHPTLTNSTCPGLGNPGPSHPPGVGVPPQRSPESTTSVNQTGWCTNSTCPGLGNPGPSHPPGVGVPPQRSPESTTSVGWRRNRWVALRQAAVRRARRAPETA